MKAFRLGPNDLDELPRTQAVHRGMWGPEGGPPAPLLSVTSSTQHEGMGSDSLQTVKGSRESMARWCDRDNRKETGGQKRVSYL